MPVRHVPTLGVRSTDVFEWASEMLARLEAVSAVDIDRLDEIGGRFMMLYSEAEHPKSARTEMQHLTKELLGTGLNIPVICRYLRIPTRAFLDIYLRGHMEYADQILLADELLSQGKRSREVRLATGLGAESVRFLRRHKGLPEETPHKANAERPDREEALDLAAHLYLVEGGYSYRQVRDIIHERIPSTREWLTHHIVYNVVKRFPHQGESRVASATSAA